MNTPENAAPETVSSTDCLGALSAKQRELLLEVWGETVARVKQLDDINAVAREWLALGNSLRMYAAEASDRYRLHAPNGKLNH